MHAIKRARNFIARQADHPDALKLARLVLSLETDTAFRLDELYEMQIDRFELALEVLREWRLDRYYAGKARLFDISWQLTEPTAGGAPAPGNGNVQTQ